jgi:HD-like signal output (HDOD) protein
LASTIHLARAIYEVWDDVENEEQKSLFIAQHESARALDISGLFFETVDKVRGNGRELAEKLA